MSGVDKFPRAVSEAPQIASGRRTGVEFGGLAVTRAASGSKRSRAQVAMDRLPRQPRPSIAEKYRRWLHAQQNQEQNQ